LINPDLMAAAQHMNVARVCWTLHATCALRREWRDLRGSRRHEPVERHVPSDVHAASSKP